MQSTTITSKKKYTVSKHQADNRPHRCVQHKNQTLCYLIKIRTAARLSKDRDVHHCSVKKQNWTVRLVKTSNITTTKLITVRRTNFPQKQTSKNLKSFKFSCFSISSGFYWMLESLFGSRGLVFSKMYLAKNNLELDTTASGNGSILHWNQSTIFHQHIGKWKTNIKRKIFSHTLLSPTIAANRTTLNSRETTRTIDMDVNNDAPDQEFAHRPQSTRLRIRNIEHQIASCKVAPEEAGGPRGPGSVPPWCEHLSITNIIDRQVLRSAQIKTDHELPKILTKSTRVFCLTQKIQMQDKQEKNVSGQLVNNLLPRIFHPSVRSHCKPKGENLWG